MSPSQSYTVRPISYDDCKEWCLYKHYAHRIPVISYAYGLYDSDLTLVGICTYGLPANPSIGKGAFSGDWGERLYELNRLCVNEGLPKNTLSFFLSQTFRLLPKPIALVSYADSAMGHHGYIYQATNWLYTGLSDRHIQYRIEGLEGKHDRHTLDETKKVGRGGGQVGRPHRPLRRRPRQGGGEIKKTPLLPPPRGQTPEAGNAQGTPVPRPLTVPQRRQLPLRCLPSVRATRPPLLTAQSLKRGTSPHRGPTSCHPRQHIPH